MVTLTCMEALDGLLDFLEGSLSPEVRHGLEDHLRLCSPCGQLLESYTKTTVLCSKVLKKDLPVGLSDRLLIALRETISREGRK